MEASPRFYAVAWTFYLVLAIAGLLWIGVRGDLSPALFASAERWPAELGAGLAVAGVLVGLWRVARRWWAAARRLERRFAELVGSIAGDEVFALAVMSGVAEEIFFRGAVQGSIGWLWATLLFTALHTGPGREFRLWTLFAAVAGLLFAGLFAWSGTLLAPIVAHAAVNGVNLRLLLRSPPGAA